MTIVEFYDKSHIENIASSFLCASSDESSPMHVIFVGDNRKRMEKSIGLYREVIGRRNLCVDFSWKTVNRSNLQSIVDVLTEIVTEHPGCVFDLTGGEDLILVAVGIVVTEQKAKGNEINLHRFNVRTNTLLDCDADGTTLAAGSDLLTIDENIRIHGGRVIYDSEDPEGTFVWDFCDEFRADIDRMWDICKLNPSLWNAQINTLDKVSDLLGQKNTEELHLCASTHSTRSAMAADGDKFVLRPDLLKTLERAGLIENLYITDDEFSLTFKDYPVKRALTQAGTVLELFVTMTAAGLYEADDQPVYDDVLCGVSIDWDGELTEDSGEPDIKNEIDVLLMHGMVPVFLSCKNGYVDADELYKLSAVADRFGRGYAKKVLVVSDLDRMGAAGDYIKARADDMDIVLIDNASELTDIELARRLKNIW